MKSSAHSSETPLLEITCTDVLEHCFCPRFTYFEHVLDIPERQEKRFKVQKGRAIHDKVASINAGYLRKKIGCVDRRFNVHLSTDDGLIGVVDEVLTLSDGSMAPLDYKFAEYPGRIYKTHRVQVAFYGHLIEHGFRRSVNKGFLVYTRAKNKLVEVSIGVEEQGMLLRSVVEIKTILSQGRLPQEHGSRMRCPDCCYKNICDRGSE